MNNPLRELCERLGLNPAALAAQIGRRQVVVEAALAAEPDDPLLAYLQVSALLGVSLRVKADQRAALWIDANAVDALLYDPQWRRMRKLEALPANRGELRELIRTLRRRRRTYGDIMDYFQDNWIPTVAGHRNWRRGTIGQTLAAKRKAQDTMLPLRTTDEFRCEWRQYVMADFITQITPFDPFAQVRYEMGFEDIDGKIWITSKLPIVTALRRWMIAAIVRLGWFKVGQWGEGEKPRNADEHGALDGAGRGDERPEAEKVPQERNGAPEGAGHFAISDTADLPAQDSRGAEAAPSVG